MHTAMTGRICASSTGVLHQELHPLSLTGSLTPPRLRLAGHRPLVTLHDTSIAMLVSSRASSVRRWARPARAWTCPSQFWSVLPTHPIPGHETVCPHQHDLQGRAHAHSLRLAPALAWVFLRLLISVPESVLHAHFFPQLPAQLHQLLQSLQCRPSATALEAASGAAIMVSTSLFQQCHA